MNKKDSFVWIFRKELCNAFSKLIAVISFPKIMESFMVSLSSKSR